MLDLESFCCADVPPSSMTLAYIEEYYSQSEDWEMLEFLLKRIHAVIGLQRYDLTSPADTGEWVRYSDIIAILRGETNESAE